MQINNELDNQLNNQLVNQLNNDEEELNSANNLKNLDKKSFQSDDNE